MKPATIINCRNKILAKKEEETEKIDLDNNVIILNDSINFLKKKNLIQEKVTACEFLNIDSIKSIAAFKLSYLTDKNFLLSKRANEKKEKNYKTSELIKLLNKGKIMIKSICLNVLIDYLDIIRKVEEPLIDKDAL